MLATRSLYLAYSCRKISLIWPLHSAHVAVGAVSSGGKYVSSSGHDYKLAALVYKALNGLSPQYLADHCINTSQPPTTLIVRPTLLRVRFQELTQVGSFDRPPLLDRVHGTDYTLHLIQ